MPKRLSKAERGSFLKRRHVAVLATIGAGGEPVLTPIWYLYRGGKILMRTGKLSAKAKNIERDPRVTVCVQDERPPYASVTIYGHASVEPPKRGLGAKIARRYLGLVGGMGYMSVAAERIEREGGGVTLVVMPERALSQDFSAETPAVGRAWLLVKRILPPWL